MDADVLERYRASLLFAISESGGIATTQDLLTVGYDDLQISGNTRDARSWRGLVRNTLFYMLQDDLVSRPFGILDDETPDLRDERKRWLATNGPGQLLAQQIWKITTEGRAFLQKPPFNLGVRLSATGAMAQTMVNYAEEQDHNGYFDPKDEIDARHRVATEIVRRRGQPQFRQKLLKAYQKKCAISSTSVEQTLEAAHILPYMGDHTNHITNGLLLRSDLHTLFDLGLIAINPDSMHVVISPDLIDTVYGEFSGKHLRLPEDEKDRPDREGLSRHRRNSGL